MNHLYNKRQILKVDMFPFLYHLCAPSPLLFYLNLFRLPTHLLNNQEKSGVLFVGLSEHYILEKLLTKLQDNLAGHLTWIYIWRLSP